MDDKRPIRVAIVGSGMAGLATAWLLHRDPSKRYAVKLFESVCTTRSTSDGKKRGL